MSELAALMVDLTQPDAGCARDVTARARQVLRPPGALARLDEVASWLAGWQRTVSPSIVQPVAIVFVADHGVAADGVSAYPAAVTAAMLNALEEGVATATALARVSGVELRAVDVGVGQPTKNIRVEAAMNPVEFDVAVRAGVAAVASSDADVLILGEMGIGNTTSAAAISNALFSGTAADWTGAGTGVLGTDLEAKIAMVHEAVHRLGSVDPIEVLRQLGGSELAAIAGATMEARRRSIPVVLDGFIVTAAVAPLELAISGALDHCWAGHRSPEPGHTRLLERLDKIPLLELDLRLGEGSGALAALPLIRMAAAAVTDVATFEEWGLT